MRALIIFFFLSSFTASGQFAQHRLVHRIGEAKEQQVNEVDLYFLIGDSNQNGALEEPVGMDAKYLDVADRVLIYYKPDRTSTDDGEWQKYSIRATATEDVNRWPGNTHAGTYYFGQDQSFVYKLNNESPRLSAIIKVARGGSSLISQAGTDNDWAKGTLEDAQPGGAELYSAFFTHFMLRALPALREINKYGFKAGRVKTKAIIIRLGTNDCLTGVYNSATFTASVSEFTRMIRRKMDATIPIYWVQVRGDLDDAPSGDYTTANVDDARSVINSAATVIPEMNLITYETDGLQADGVHFDYDAYVAQGEYEAGLMLSIP